MSDLEAIAEGDAHARWIVENHVGGNTERPRCAICEQWWPCDLVSLAALAVLRAQEHNAALALADERQALAEMLTDRQRYIHAELHVDERGHPIGAWMDCSRPTCEDTRAALAGPRQDGPRETKSE